MLFVNNKYQPLAERMRPRNLKSFIGQEHLLAKGKPLQAAIVNDHLHSDVS
jgi:putative ATPase